MRKIKFISALLILITWTPLISKAQVKPITGTITDGKGHPIFRGKYYYSWFHTGNGY